MTFILALTGAQLAQARPFPKCPLESSSVSTGNTVTTIRNYEKTVKTTELLAFSTNFYPDLARHNVNCEGTRHSRVESDRYEMDRDTCIWHKVHHTVSTENLDEMHTITAEGNGLFYAGGADAVGSSELEEFDYQGETTRHRKVDDELHTTYQRRPSMTNAYKRVIHRDSEAIGPEAHRDVVYRYSYDVGGPRVLYTSSENLTDQQINEQLGFPNFPSRADITSGSNAGPYGECGLSSLEAYARQMGIPVPNPIPNVKKSKKGD